MKNRKRAVKAVKNIKSPPKKNDYEILYRELEFSTMNLRKVYQQKTKELEVANEKLKLTNKALEELSIKDYFTNLYNYRYFSKAVGGLLKKASQTKQPICCIFIDIDYFKDLNDECDHQFGDFVLRRLGHIFSLVLRKNDILARYGGDEFVVALPNTTYPQALSIAERISQDVKAEVFSDGEFSRKATVSIGVSCYPCDKISSRQQLVRFADYALYRSKGRGKNTIFCYKDVGPRD